MALQRTSSLNFQRVSTTLALYNTTDKNFYLPSDKAKHFRSIQNVNSKQSLFSSKISGAGVGIWLAASLFARHVVKLMLTLTSRSRSCPRIFEEKRDCSRSRQNVTKDSVVSDVV